MSGLSRSGPEACDCVDRYVQSYTDDERQKPALTRIHPLGACATDYRCRDRIMASRQLLRTVDAQGPHQVSTPLLLVEDDPQVRGMMAMLLEGEGYPVLVAADGWDAIQYLQASRPSLVILDLNLPYVDGDEVGARVRERYGHAVPILVVTASKNGAEMADALDAAYVAKPFDVDELLLAVGCCLNHQ
jgi:CheY-like chemotaxis protein